MLFDHHMPARILSGEGCVQKHADKLRALGKRALLVTGKRAAKQSGALDDVCAALDAAGVAYARFDDMRENPPLSAVAAAGAFARETGAEFIVGIGGGSTLDGAKAACVFAKNSFTAPSDIYKGAYTEALPLVCVGTTAGTGSEVTDVAVLTNDATGVKKSIKKDALFAKCVFCDPRYTYSMDYSQTVSTALDALCHCLESWFSTAASEATDAFARRGVELIFPQLASLARGDFDAKDKTMREALYYGSLWGGLAINMAGTGFPHPISYVLTEKTGLPHGVACALFETAFLSHSLPERPRERERLLDIVGAEQKLYDVLAALTKNDFRFSAAMCDEIGRRLQGASNTKRTLGDFSWEKGQQVAERLFLNKSATAPVTGGWLL